jgi:hypothetical protein
LYGRIKVEIELAEKGSFNKTVTVFCNVDGGLIPLSVKGTVTE